MLPKIVSQLQQTEIQKTKQSKTEKDKQNKTKTKPNNHIVKIKN